MHEQQVLNPNEPVEIAKIKPQIQLSISTRHPKITKETEAMLISSFGEIGCCASCGVEIHAKSRKNIHYEGGWFSACLLCFYTENLDMIPAFEKGKVIFQPFLGQTQAFTLMRTHLAQSMIDAANRDLAPEVEEVLSNNLHTVQALLDKLSHGSGRSNSKNTHSVDTLVHTMDILPPELYAQRYKNFIDLRWIPEVRMLKADHESRTDHHFESLHPEKNDGFIRDFVSKYKLPFSVD